MCGWARRSSGHGTTAEAGTAEAPRAPEGTPPVSGPPVERTDAQAAEPSASVDGAAAFRPDARACLVQTIYHEARGEGEEGMAAVGWVVLNRRASVAYPDTVCGVVRQADDLGRCQFSWFCDGRSDALAQDDARREAEAVADALLAGADDPTNGATSFHAARVRPAWADELTETARIGAHVFYANETGEGG